MEYAVTGDTLLDDRLGYEAVTGWVEETGDALGTDLGDDEVILDGNTFGLAEGLDLTPLLGLEVRAWLSDDVIVWAD